MIMMKTPAEKDKHHQRTPFLTFFDIAFSFVPPPLEKRSESVVAIKKDRFRVTRPGRRATNTKKKNSATFLSH